MNMKSLTGITHAFEAAVDLEGRLTEINRVPDSSNILKPLGHFRQQEQQSDQSTGKYTADNFEVFVFKKLRMDLKQFRNVEYSQLIDPNCQLLLFIKKECFKR